MHDHPVALVTGANKGIGLQVAKDLLAHGMTVIVGSRDLARGEAAATSLGAGANAVQLDVTDADSIAAAARHIGNTFGRLDVLVNNAGIASAGKPDRSMDTILEDSRACVASLPEVRAVFETNVFGVIAVTQAMLPLLRRSAHARVVNVSSGRASLTRTASHAHALYARFGAVYAPSKTALNAITLAFAAELEDAGIKVNAAAPGFTRTDMNLGAGSRSVEQAATVITRLALLDDNGPTGTFQDENGPLPW